MPKIKPLNVSDCVEFLEKHKQEIINGDYDVIINHSSNSDWVDNINHEYLSFLAKYCPSSKQAIAKLSIHKNVLNYLYLNSNNDILWGLARNPSTPIEILSKLAKNEDVQIRRGVAENPSTPIDSLEILARDGEHFVRSGIAVNPKAPVYIKNKL